MMSGSDFLKGMTSLFSLSMMMCIVAQILVQCMILENIVSFRSQIDQLDQQTYLEVVTMQRIKESFRNLKMEETLIQWEDAIIKIEYDQKKAMVTYQVSEREWKRTYQYVESGDYLIIDH
ncbi:MAG: hypothetical protein PUF50_07715 [Erysipelotrichaceae bacterium]|nr:hypothetical protein [Erysipelotrichaceae bacterium]